MEAAEVYAPQPPSINYVDKIQILLFFFCSRVARANANYECYVITVNCIRASSYRLKTFNMVALQVHRCIVACIKINLSSRTTISIDDCQDFRESCNLRIYHIWYGITRRPIFIEKALFFKTDVYLQSLPLS